MAYSHTERVDIRSKQGAVADIVKVVEKTGRSSGSLKLAAWALASALAYGEESAVVLEEPAGLSKVRARRHPRSIRRLTLHQPR